MNRQIFFRPLELLVFCLSTILTLIGCSKNANEVFEKENLEMVAFPIDFYTSAMNSVPGQPIKFKMDDASFECKIEIGSFEYYNDVKETIAKSNETIYYCPTYKRDDDFVKEYGTSFVDVVVKTKIGAVGYAVVKILYDESKNDWRPQLLVSNLFVDKNEKTTSVNDDYLKNKITNYHTNSEG